MKINVIILSAGYSRRMNEFKPLSLYKEKSFLENIIIKLNKVCDKLIIVTGYKSAELKNEIIKNLIVNSNTSIIKKIVFAHNKNYDKGMFGSIQTGILECANSDWILLHQVDQPGIPKKFYTDFTSQIDSEHNWIQPSFKNKYGHPILINKLLFSLITDENIASNLRVISKNKKIIKKIWDCNYKEILQDIDTKEDYWELLRSEKL